jgi:hypothetical protein
MLSIRLGWLLFVLLGIFMFPHGVATSSGRSLLQSLLIVIYSVINIGNVLKANNDRSALSNTRYHGALSNTRYHDLVLFYLLV